MPKPPRIDNEILLQAGLELMLRNGKSLERVHSTGRQMRYRTPNNETVRVRTCNDHVLIAVADRPEPDARLNIDGTDWLLIVMPELPRTPGPVVAYLVPTKIAVSEVREAHQAWLASNPNTKGENTTWNIWFSEGGPGRSNGFAQKWARFLLPGTVSTNNFLDHTSLPKQDATLLKDEVAAAQERIARIAGVKPEAVKISINFEA